MTHPREPLVDAWTAFVERGAEFAEEALETIEARLLDSEIPGAIISRDGLTLSIRINAMPDYLHEIRVSPYGAHLKLDHRLLLAPGLLKQGLAQLLTADRYAWSRAGSEGAAWEVAAAVSAIQHQLVEAGKDLAARIGPGHSRPLDLEELLRRW